MRGIFLPDLTHYPYLRGTLESLKCDTTQSRRGRVSQDTKGCHDETASVGPLGPTKEGLEDGGGGRRRLSSSPYLLRYSKSDTRKSRVERPTVIGSRQKHVFLIPDDHPCTDNSLAS